MATKTVDKVEIRMYRIGTGDCIVLKFLYDDQSTFTMMIDCGSCKGTADKFKPYIENIINYTKNHVNLLVVTHEHSDHINGFAKCMKLFQEMKIDNVWLGWPDNPNDDMAKTLKERYRKDSKALSLAISKYTEHITSPAYNTMLKKDYEGENIKNCKEKFLTGLKNIYSLIDDENSFAAAGQISETKKAMDFITNGIKAKNMKLPFYCYPGEKVPELEGLEGVNIYILGPPIDEALLKKEEIADEMYKRKYKINSDFDFVNALTDRGGTAQIMLPFSKEYIMSQDEKRLFKNEKLENENDAWRNIEIDWLQAAGTLAIRLERFMNNLSLVMAIELQKSGKVLLFPGDAQLGNWKSWHNEKLKWKVERDQTTHYITAKDLLRNTVIYKAGHHLSHNGTASKSGLDLMEHEELTAFATLDLNNINSIWEKTMPSPGILDALIPRTKGRLFTIDDGLTEKYGAKEARNRMLKKEQENFTKSYIITDEYIQYTITG